MNTGNSLGSLARRPGFLLSRVGTAVQAGFKDVLGGWRIRPLDFLVLISVKAAEGSSQQELCRALGIDSGNMVELLDKLEELGYAKRIRDTKDRRRQLVKTTPAGRSALSQITDAVDAYDARFFAPLEQDEQARLVEILTKLYAATAEARGKGYVAGPPTGSSGSMAPLPDASTPSPASERIGGAIRRRRGAVPRRSIS